jgi:hypothetical protein
MSNPNDTLFHQLEQEEEERQQKLQRQEEEVEKREDQEDRRREEKRLRRLEKIEELRDRLILQGEFNEKQLPIVKKELHRIKILEKEEEREHQREEYHTEILRTAKDRQLHHLHPRQLLRLKQQRHKRQLEQ